MLFTSLEFLFLFFPIVFGVYYFLPLKGRNYWLLFTSLLFYAWGEPQFVFIMIISIAFNYMMALFIEGERALEKKLLMAFTVAVNLGILFIFKYLNFVTGTLNDVLPFTRSMFSQTSFVLPIGISFFTFQALSYVIDVYRGIPAQHNIGYLGLYISLFPQLIAGPIVRYTTVMNEITDRTVKRTDFADGLMRFFIGFNKKMLLANILAQVADEAFSLNGGSVCMAWLGALAYTLQIFFDFSGYSDMAIGLGRMFGFHFLENFDYPYISQTITEFWRRWHISLGSWFRDYVYFPLGGSRVDSRKRLIFNLSVVWLLTGIWHGANWTFILWGVLYGVVIIIEKLLNIPKSIKNWNVLGRIGYRVLSLLLVIIGWVFFRADTLPQAGSYLLSMFGLNGNGWIDSSFTLYAREYMVFLGMGMMCSTPFFKWLKKKLAQNGPRMDITVQLAGDLTQLILFVVSISFLVMNAHNPFIYFNF